MIKLTLTQIKFLHQLIVDEIGGSHGIRDINLLESAINVPFQTFDREYIYPSLESQASRLCFGIIKNHPFIDGNKRIGILVMLTFLELNGIIIECSDDELIQIGLSLADGSMTEAALLEWIITYI